jgi:hypothetical protein
MNPSYSSRLAPSAIDKTVSGDIHVVREMMRWTLPTMKMEATEVDTEVCPAIENTLNLNLF